MIGAAAIRGWANEAAGGWNRFWFTPAEPHALCAIRVLAGGMIFYTHLVWTLGLMDFLGPQAWIDRETARMLSAQVYAWSPLFHFDSPLAVWCIHVIALASSAALFLGIWTRPAAILTWVLTLSYCHRLQGALFGLDQVNAMLAMYLMIGPSGAVYSVDRWRADRRGAPGPAASIGVNIAIRLIQLHMCVIYLFGGIGKMRGELWWNGLATWYAAANLEYQSLDLTWLAWFPVLAAVLTHVTVFWETFYCFLVWPKLTRPLTLGLAVMVHGGIALFLGMITFGLAMIFGNLAFVSPSSVDAAVGWLMRRKRLPTTEQGTARPRRRR